MKTLDDNRLVKTFAELKSAGRKALLPFITAGFPDLETTEAILHEFQRRGVRVCELGVPFSDPIADGPVIQSSYAEALARGVTSEQIFETVRRFRTSGGSIAINVMVSYSIVFRHGVEKYLASAAQAGFDGLIIPDLPMEETAAIEPPAAANGLCNVMLIAPTTSPRRRDEISRHSRGFIYFISVAGTTGQRDKLPEATIAAVADLRKRTDTPVCVGFGIAKPKTVAQVCLVADGAIVGSAIVHRIAQAAKEGLSREELVERAGRFVGELMTPIAH